MLPLSNKHWNKGRGEDLGMTDQELLQAISAAVKNEVEPLRQEMKGEIQGIRGELQEVRGELLEMKGEIQEVRGEIQEVREELQEVKTRLTKVEEETQEIKTRLTRVEEETQEIKIRLTKVEEETGEIKTRLTKVEEETASTRMLLENELSKKIDIIGEGHDFLKQRLENALTMEMKREAMELQIVNMQIDIKKMKESIADHDEKLQKIS